MDIKIEKIVTHPGGAHKDDVLAVCVLASIHGVPVFRRDPTPEEVQDPRVALVDIGGSDDAALSNFDHHHFERDHPPTCSLSLVFQSLGLYEDALKFCDWLETAEYFDSRGPKKTAEHLGVPRRALSQLNSPVDITLLRRFAGVKELSPGETLYEFMRMVGDDLLAHLKSARERIDFVASRVERWSIPKDGVDIQALFLPRPQKGDEETDDPSVAVANYIRDQELERDIHAMVYPDRRGDGYGIARYEDHPALDFSRVQDEDDIRFAHKSGFVCKTSATDKNRLQEIIRGAWKMPEA
jgi:hypothetical protein